MCPFLSFKPQTLQGFLVLGIAIDDKQIFEFCLS